MSSRSARLSVLSPRRRISASSLRGAAVSGRKVIGPRIPGRPSGSSMKGMASEPGIRIGLDVHERAEIPPVALAAALEHRDRAGLGPDRDQVAVAALPEVLVGKRTARGDLEDLLLAGFER